MDLGACKNQMWKIIEHLDSEFNTLQVGKASISILDGINVETSYGFMKIPQLANVTLLDSQTIKVEVRDKSVLWAVQKAIYDSDLGLAPSVELSYILVKVPPLTQERRLDIVKKVKAMWEDSKAALRRTRQEALKHGDKLLLDKEISENEHKINEENINILTKEYTKKIDDVVKSKSEDLMKI